MRILSPNFIKKFDGKIINIHPSLLPKYKGLNTHVRAIRNNEKFTGCTVHYVTAKLDSGKIIMQKKIKILPKDNSASLAKKVLKKEHKLYPSSILKIFN
jgi:folate-dependent phosphoribosylglycinamide formyltransferase PurN